MEIEIEIRKLKVRNQKPKIIQVQLYLARPDARRQLRRRLQEKLVGDGRQIALSTGAEEGANGEGDQVEHCAHLSHHEVHQPAEEHDPREGREEEGEEESEGDERCRPEQQSEHPKVSGGWKGVNENVTRSTKNLKMKMKMRGDKAVISSALKGS